MIVYLKTQKQLVFSYFFVTMIHFKDNKNKSALSTRWAQMSKQEQIIERKKMEIQAKVEAQKQAAALAAQAKLSKYVYPSLKAISYFFLFSLNLRKLCHHRSNKNSEILQFVKITSSFMLYSNIFLEILCSQLVLGAGFH